MIQQGGESFRPSPALNEWRGQMQRAYKYRIYPSNAQETILERWLALCCELYNAALQERRDAYRIAHKSVSYREQANQLPEIKEIRPELGMIHSQVLQDSLKRLMSGFCDPWHF